MSTHFGDTVERVANFYGSNFSLLDIRHSILIRTRCIDTVVNDTKIRYHLKRLGYIYHKNMWVKNNERY